MLVHNLNNIFRRQCVFVALFLVLFATTLPQPAHAAGLVPCGGYAYVEGPDGYPVIGDDGKPVKAGAEKPCDFTFFMEMLNDIIAFLLFKLAMPLAAFMFAYAGFLYLTSGVKPEQREQAKKILTNVVWGLVIALAAWLIVHTILTSLGVDKESIFLTNPSDGAPTP